MLPNFAQFHRWNSLLCPPLGFLTNLALVWLILRKTPKEMRIHSRILLQTCIVDLLLLSIIAIAQPVLAFQPDFTGIVLFRGYFAQFFRDSPISLVSIFSLWYFLHTFDMTGVSIQFLYRFLVLNCHFRITLPRYFALLAVLLLPVSALSILWFIMASKLLNFSPYNAEYFAKFMDAESAQNAVKITYLMNINSVEFWFWDKLFIGIQVVAYGTVLFCGIKMVRFVYANSLNHKQREMNKQLSINLIILASFPLFLLSLNCFFRFASSLFPLDISTLISLLEGLLAHWLPVLNPLTSIFTIKPYRNFLIRKFKKATINPGPTNQITVELVQKLQTNKIPTI